MCSSCQGLPLGAINGVGETFPGSVLMGNPLLMTSPSPGETCPLPNHRQAIGDFAFAFKHFLVWEAD